MWSMLANKRHTYHHGIHLVLVLLLLSTLLTGCTSQTASTTTSEYINPGALTEDSYKTATSFIGNFTVSFEASTKMTALRITELYWEYSGDKYVSINVREGDFVKKDDVLAEIEVNISEADYLQRQLNVTEAYASINEINTNYTQRINQATADLSGLSGTQYELALKELALLKAEYSERLSAASSQAANAEASLAEMDEHKNTTKILAPYDGYVGGVIWGWEEGTAVPSYTPLIYLADMSTIAFRVTNTSPYGNVPYLSKVKLVDQKDKKEYTGTVVSCSDLTGTEEDELVILPDDLSGADQAALTGAVKVSGTVLDKKDVILVDSNALYKDGDSYYVLVLQDGVAVSKTYVLVGGISAGLAWITDGLDAGETVILN